MAIIKATLLRHQKPKGAESLMDAKKLKDWVNGLPDDALIQVLASPIMSLPLPKPVFHAIDNKTIKEPIQGMLSGKVISSLDEKGL